MKTFRITLTGLHDLRLSLRAAASYSPAPAPAASTLKRAVRIHGKAGILGIEQVKNHPG